VLCRLQVTIVGVAPPEFHGDFPGTAMDGWIPVPPTGERRRDARNFQAIVRLKPGVSISEANAETGQISAGLVVNNVVKIAISRGFGPRQTYNDSTTIFR
jgi:hypothetical protein